MRLRPKQTAKVFKAPRENMRNPAPEIAERTSNKHRGAPRNYIWRRLRPAIPIPHFVTVKMSAQWCDDFSAAFQVDYGIRVTTLGNISGPALLM